MKLILFSLWSEFKIDASNGIHDFTLFKLLKDMSTLTSYIPLNVLTLNLDFSFEMEKILFTPNHCFQIKQLRIFTIVF